ncbi:MAG: exosome complex protein Rrp4 [Methanobrevibacter olleyae]|uniref:Exosome complex component Rrp4 n=1 Tax=Methanobrevibacter olleyae TaxID=294671 RepID=A0A8T3VNG3_METOL|nr:exosome complex protein Rrp4 [Methanobrevibacter olleyae]
MIYVNEKDLVVPGELLAEDDYYPGRGTFEDDGKICSKLLGLVSLRNKKISVIPLKSKYLPKKGDVVIGKIDDVRFSMWGVDINSPYSGILPASEVFGREKKELSRVFDIGDVLFLRIVDVDEVKKVKLGLKGRGMGKFKGGVIVDIAPTKVPRLIGKKGSMINMIKDKTGCKIVVGQNGLVWVKGNEDMEQIVKNIIKLIEREAHTSGLTDRIKNKLCLLIDGELPPEEEEAEEAEQEAEQEAEEDAFEEGLKKPELQDFRDEVEKELAEEGFLDEDSEDDLDDDEDSEDEEFEDDLEDFNDETEDYEDIDEEDLDDDEDSEDEDEDDDLDNSEEEIEDFEDDISDEELEDVISEAISEDEEEIVEESEDDEDSEDSEEEIVEESEDDEDSEDSEDEAAEESEDEDVLEDSEESPEEDDGEESEDEEEDSEDDEKEEKSKKPNFMDTYEYINEQKKNNKSSFDLSRADNSKSPTLNISQGRGI